jgi:copper(I)-binding protein
MSFLVRALSALPAIAFASVASAHVTLESREAKAGSNYKAVLKVGHGCDASATIKVRAVIPEGVIGVKPIETTRGSEGVKEIVWTGKLLDENYDEFVFSSQLTPDLKPGPLYFPVTQICEKGEIVWKEIPAAGQDAHALKAPAPALMILAQAASADAGKTFKAGTISVEAAWSRATPGGAQVAGGYMKITNNGKDADRLTGGNFPIASKFEVHEMKTVGDVMTMRPVTSLDIKPGETIEFKPGGYHVMFMGLKQGLKEGDTIKGTLTFEKAGKLDVEYRVGPIGGGSAPAGAGGHQHH